MPLLSMYSSASLRTSSSLLLIGLVGACSESVAPSVPDSPSTEMASSTEATLAQQSPATFTFRILDRCEPESFNGAIGPGTCVGDGKVTFDEFIAELMKKQTHRQWRNQPTKVALKAGRDLSVVNVGGEEHTFTPVVAFGGGFVADLNALTGNPVPAPECLDFGSIEFVPAGGTADLGSLAAGTHRFMCCIHPWMRTTAEVR